MKYIRDEEFIRGNIPMTKYDVRILTIAMLEIEKGDVFLDIGAGTGSISIEAARSGAEVIAIEREDEGVELINKNAEKFGVHIDVIKGEAPEGLPNAVFNKCFIGGSGGRLREIFSFIDKNMEPNGIVAANFITLNNLGEFLNLLKEYDYKDCETKLLQVSYMDKGGLLKAHNPIFTARGRKP